MRVYMAWTVNAAQHRGKISAPGITAERVGGFIGAFFVKKPVKILAQKTAGITGSKRTPPEKQSWQRTLEEHRHSKRDSQRRMTGL